MRHLRAATDVADVDRALRRIWPAAESQRIHSLRHVAAGAADHPADGSDHVLDAKENVIELAEQLEQVAGQHVVPGFLDHADRLPAPLPPFRNAAEREELIRMAED